MAAVLVIRSLVMIFATLNERTNGFNCYLTENPGKSNQFTMFSKFVGSQDIAIATLKNAAHCRGVDIDIWEMYDINGVQQALTVEV
jgi:hypothetical protein